MDEMFEMLTWAQLGLHRYPCAFLNVRGYYDRLRDMVEHMANEGFITPGQRESVWFGQDMASLFDWMPTYQGERASRLVDKRIVDA
jgi:hypothetical protein